MFRTRTVFRPILPVLTVTAVFAAGAGAGSAWASGRAPGSVRSAAVSCPPAGGVAVAEASATGELVFAGHGWGHGMGMSQYGAQGAARLGCGYATILGTYYTGTRLRATAMSAPVQLALMSGARRSTLLAETGAVRWSGGLIQPRGSTWIVVPRVKAVHGRATAGVSVFDLNRRERLWLPAGRTLAAAHSGSIVTLRSSGTGSARYLRTRWDVAQFGPATAGSLAVNELIVGGQGRTAAQKYLLGVAEVPVSWPQQALRAQAVAARTYLSSRYSSAVRAYRLTITTADQVYAGVARELTDAASGSGWRQAVDATNGQVLVDGHGRTITAMYSSSMGGYTEDRQYVYGATGISYLKAVDDSRWDRASDDPNRAWAVGLSRTTLAARLGFSSISSVSIGARGSAARLAGLRVTGVAKGRRVTVDFTGAQVRSRLRLRSPGFTVTAGAPVPTRPLASSTPLAADFDGDGRVDLGWFTGGRWHLRLATGSTAAFAFGSTGDLPVVGDWDGDGKAGIGVFRDGVWYLRQTAGAGSDQLRFHFGRPGDVPVTGAWAGSRGSGIGVVRGTLWYQRLAAGAGDADRWFVWTGVSGTPVTGDWNGDGSTDPGVRSGITFVLGISPAGTGTLLAPTTRASVTFGRVGDLPLAADWDRNGTATPAVARGTVFSWRNDTAGGNGTGSLTFAP